MLGLEDGHSPAFWLLLYGNGARALDRVEAPFTCGKGVDKGLGFVEAPMLGLTVLCRQFVIFDRRCNKLQGSYSLLSASFLS